MKTVSTDELVIGQEYHLDKWSGTRGIFVRLDEDGDPEFELTTPNYAHYGECNGVIPFLKTTPWGIVEQPNVNQ